MALVCITKAPSRPCDLPAWAIVVCGAAIGVISLLILCPALMLLLGWWVGVSEPPALSCSSLGRSPMVVAGFSGKRPIGHLRQKVPSRLSQRRQDRRRRNSEPVVGRNLTRSLAAPQRAPRRLRLQ
jgi:hypothetical protein